MSIESPADLPATVEPLDVRPPPVVKDKFLSNLFETESRCRKRLLRLRDQHFLAKERRDKAGALVDDARRAFREANRLLNGHIERHRFTGPESIADDMRLHGAALAANTERAQAWLAEVECQHAELDSAVMSAWQKFNMAVDDARRTHPAVVKEMADAEKAEAKALREKQDRERNVRPVQSYWLVCRRAYAEARFATGVYVETDSPVEQPDGLVMIRLKTQLVPAFGNESYQAGDIVKTSRKEAESLHLPRSAGDRFCDYVAEAEHRPPAKAKR